MSSIAKPQLINSYLLMNGNILIDQTSIFVIGIIWSKQVL